MLSLERNVIVGTMNGIFRVMNVIVGARNVIDGAMNSIVRVRNVIIGARNVIVRAMNSIVKSGECYCWSKEWYCQTVRVMKVIVRVRMLLSE